MNINCGNFARNVFCPVFVQAVGCNPDVLSGRLLFKENEMMKLRTELRGQERACGDWVTLFACLNCSSNT